MLSDGPLTTSRIELPDLGSGSAAGSTPTEVWGSVSPCRTPQQVARGLGVSRAGSGIVQGTAAV
jgi:hypothetical protein